MVVQNADNLVVWGRLGSTPGYGQRHRSIERIQRPMREAEHGRNRREQCRVVSRRGKLKTAATDASSAALSADAGG